MVESSLKYKFVSDDNISYDYCPVETEQNRFRMRGNFKSAVVLTIRSPSASTKKNVLTEDLILIDALEWASTHNGKLPSAPDSKEWASRNEAIRHRYHGLTRENCKGLGHLFQIYGLKTGYKENTDVIQRAWKNLQEDKPHGLKDDKAAQSILTQDQILTKAIVDAASDGWKLPTSRHGIYWEIADISLRQQLRGLTRPNCKGLHHFLHAYGLKLGYKDNVAVIQEAYRNIQAGRPHGLVDRESDDYIAKDKSKLPVWSEYLTQKESAHLVNRFFDVVVRWEAKRAPRDIACLVEHFDQLVKNNVRKLGRNSDKEKDDLIAVGREAIFMLFNSFPILRRTSPLGNYKRISAYLNKRVYFTMLDYLGAYSSVGGIYKSQGKRKPRKFVSLNDGEKGRGHIYDVDRQAMALSPDPVVHEVEMAQLLNRFSEASLRLPARAQDILQLRIVEEMDMKSIGNIFDVSESMICLTYKKSRGVCIRSMGETDQSMQKYLGCRGRPSLKRHAHGPKRPPNTYVFERGGLTVPRKG